MATIHEDDYDIVDADVEPVEIDDSDDVETDTVSRDIDSSEKSDDDSRLTDADLAEAESLTVTAKQSIRQQLEDEVARFLAAGGNIVEVPADDSVRD